MNNQDREILETILMSLLSKSNGIILEIPFDENYHQELDLLTHKFTELELREVKGKTNYEIYEQKVIIRFKDKLKEVI